MKNQILKERYFWKDKDGNPIEDWAALCRRVAKAVARTPEEKKQFYRVMHDCLFLPNTPALTNAGREEFSMSACFVLPVEDSIDGIYDTLKNTAIVHKMGGGTGFSFSRLRPEGDMVGTTKGVASGPCSFMKIFNTGTDVMKQGGTRRGANMGILRVDHPDIMQFINIKKEDGDFSNFNISVAVTDEFLEAVRANEDFDLRFAGTTRKTVKAREIWNAIIERAWANGEPGLLFMDAVNRGNPTPHVGEFEALNPCGEQPLLPYEACVLGSVNLAKMVVDGGQIDYDLLKETVRAGVVILNSIIDRQAYPLPEIEARHRANRKVGLGVMGWADMLIMLGIHYASEEATSLAEKVMHFITGEAEKMSQELAEQYGPFPNWEGSVWQQKGVAMRNATLTTIAPTGSISSISEVNGGIEPVYDFVTIQRRIDKEFKIVHPIYRKWVEVNGEGELPDYFVKAADVPVEWHIRMQAAFQKHTHNAISKTINMPETATKEDVERAYWLAYELGCKGITVYRDGSRKNQVISTKSVSSAKEVAPVELPSVCDSKRIEIKTTEGKVFVHVTLSNGKPMEVFTTSPVESKYDEIYDAFSRVFSIALRCGIPTKLLLKQLDDANAKYGSIVSPTAAIMRAFRMLGLNGHEDACPECGGILVLEEGCNKCLSCGYSKC